MSDMTESMIVPLELKQINERQVEGYGSVFGNVDLGGDIVMKGAFAKSLAAHRKSGSMPAMFWMHDMAAPVGVWEEMSEDDRGLYVKGTLADTQLGNETRTLAKMGAVRGMSIGYKLIDVDWNERGNRLIKSVDLWEVSLVTIPMNPKARIDRVKHWPAARDTERLFRYAGYSQSVAKEVAYLVSKNQPSSEMLDSDRRDVGADLDEYAAREAAEALLMKVRLAGMKR